MYGTLARMRLKQGAEEDFRQLMDEMSADGEANMRGWVSTSVYRADSDPREVWIAVAFRDREAYHANAQSPEQDERYQKMRALLDADPEWHDGEIIAGGPK